MTEAYKKRKDAYIKAYQKRTYTSISFKFRTKDDKDVLDKLKSVPNKSDFLRTLIRQAL